jgi:hypothetical protein
MFTHGIAALPYVDLERVDAQAVKRVQRRFDQFPMKRDWAGG